MNFLLIFRVYFKNITRLPTNLGETVLLLSFIRKVLGSNLGRDTGYSEWGYPWNSGILLVTYWYNNFRWTRPLLCEP